MSIKKYLPTLVLSMTFLAGGCFPDDEGLSSVSVQLSLKDLGLERATPLLRDWQDWYDNGGPGSMVFDLGQAGRGFYLGLELSGHSPDGELSFFGSQIEVADDLLTVNLDVTQCSDCNFTATIFWEESEIDTTVSTFTGTSPAFNILPGSVPDFIDLDVYLAPTGSIRCVPSSPDYSGEVTLAVMDVQEAVIFPGITGTINNEGLVLPSIPVGRQMHVLVWSLEDGDYFTEPVFLDAAVQANGQEVEVVIDL